MALYSILSGILSKRSDLKTGVMWWRFSQSATIHKYEETHETEKVRQDNKQK